MSGQKKKLRNLTIEERATTRKSQQPTAFHQISFLYYCKIHTLQPLNGQYGYLS
jgi:hypothetical protein